MASGFFQLAAMDLPAYGHENSPSDGPGSFIKPVVSPGQSLTAQVLDRRERMPTAMSPMRSPWPHVSVSGWKLNERRGLVVPQKKTTDQLAAMEHI
jgi:hypothetical protein